MTSSFKHPQFELIDFEAIPLNRDMFIVDEQWLKEWEQLHIEFFEGSEWPNVGYVSYASVRAVRDSSLEISWYPNIIDRFHEVTTSLPREAFVCCVDIYDYDLKPHIFVKSEWLDTLHMKPYSVFALIDAIGVTEALSKGHLTGDKLAALRDRIDSIAGNSPEVAFISFADSLLIKINWHVGTYKSAINYSYAPEKILWLIPEVAKAFEDTLGLSIYAVISQGVNEYIDQSLIHQSSSGFHVSLNSLGLPFAQLLSIDKAVRDAIRSGRHGAFDLYMDEKFYHSLRYKIDFDKRAVASSTYLEPMSSSVGRYFYSSIDEILSNLETQ